MLVYEYVVCKKNYVQRISTRRKKITNVSPVIRLHESLLSTTGVLPMSYKRLHAMNGACKIY